jgi:hypothetical protein
MIRACLAVVLFAAGQADTVKVPHEDDETPLVRVKANPEKYIGKEFVICGGLEIDDYYNFEYDNAHESHYSLGFREAGETLNDLGPRAHVYLPKTIGASIVDSIVKSAEQKKAKHSYKLARVKVTLDRRRIRAGQEIQWDMLEAIDVQFCDKDKLEWQPWIIESRKQAEQAQNEEARKKEQAKREAEKKAAQEKKDVADALKWREWTGPKGAKFKAKFSGVTSGQVKLVKEDGSAVKLALDKLPKEEQDWIKEKKWTKK